MDNIQLLFHFGCGVSSDFIATSDDVDGCLQSGGCRRATHELDDIVDCVKQHSRASTTHVRKESSFDRIVLGAIGRVVSNADFNSN